MSEDNQKNTGVVVFRNSQPHEVRFRLEPWGDERQIPPGTTIEISFTGPSSGKLELDLTPDDVVLYGWTGSILEIVEPPESNG